MIAADPGWYKSDPVYLSDGCYDQPSITLVHTVAPLTLLSMIEEHEKNIYPEKLYALTHTTAFFLISCEVELSRGKNCGTKFLENV